MPKPRTQRADASSVLQVFGLPLPVAATSVPLAVSASTWKRAPSAMMRTRRTAPAATSARNTFSSIVGLLRSEQFGLGGNLDVRRLAVPADQQLDQVGDAAVFAQRGDAHGFLDGRIDAQIERGGFVGRHVGSSGCDGNVT